MTLGRIATSAVAGVLLLSVAETSNADSRDRRIMIMNATGAILTEFYASDVTQERWGHTDRLGNLVLKPGQRAWIDISDGTHHCMYDFKAVFDVGEEPIEVTRRVVNVCGTTSWIIHPTWNELK